MLNTQKLGRKNPYWPKKATTNHISQMEAKLRSTPVQLPIEILEVHVPYDSAFGGLPSLNVRRLYEQG